MSKSKEMLEAVGPETNITHLAVAAFEDLMSGDNPNKWALFSCFCNGEPTSAIVTMKRMGDDIGMFPLFVAITPGMKLTDHDGNEAGLGGGEV